MSGIKDPDATLDYSRDWSDWLADGESIATSVWEISGPDDALTEGTALHESTFDASSATIWLSGGTVGEAYKVTNRITTDNVPPRIDDRTFSLFIQER